MTPDDSLEAVKTVAVADVYKQGRLAASLRRTPHGVEFSYDASYLDAGGAAVATTLPPVHAPSLHPAGAVPPYFAGLLPEGRRLTSLRRAVKTSADDELSLLLAVGSDTVGDVQVVAHGRRPDRSAAMVEVTAWGDIRFADLLTGPEGPRIDLHAIPGVQDKASAMITLPVRQRGRAFILKLTPPEFPHLAENEAFFLDAARSSGMPTTGAELVHDRDGVAGLLVHRFDKVWQEGRLQARAQEDGCQVLGRYPADKYTMTSEEVVAALVGVTTARPVAARGFLRQIAFAYLTGNGDLHAKNLSVVQDEAGEWFAAPAYDVPSSYPYGDVTMALPVGARSREDITRTTLVDFGLAMGVRRRATEKLLDDLCARTEAWLPGLSQLPFDERRLHKLRRLIEDRRAKLTGWRPAG